MRASEITKANQDFGQLSAPQSWQPSLSPAPAAPTAPVTDPPKVDPPSTPTPSTPLPSILPAAPDHEEEGDGDEGPCPGPCKY